MYIDEKAYSYELTIFAYRKNYEVSYGLIFIDDFDYDDIDQTNYRWHL